MRYIFRHHEFVTDVTTYWAGQQNLASSNQFTQIVDYDATIWDTGIAFSYQNITMPPNSRKELRFCITAGVGSAPPILDMGGTSFPRVVSSEDQLMFAGSVASEHGDNCSLILVLNHNISGFVLLSDNIRSGLPFSFHARLIDLGLRDPQLVEMDAYAVDSYGTFSNVVHLAPVSMLARTVVKTVSPMPTPTESKSPTPTSSYPVSGAAFSSSTAFSLTETESTLGRRTNSRGSSSSRATPGRTLSLGSGRAPSRTSSLRRPLRR
jgi:hypothetical protein